VIKLRVNAKRKHVGELNPPRPKIEDGYESKGESHKRNVTYILTFSKSQMHTRYLMWH